MRKIQDQIAAWTESTIGNPSPEGLRGVPLYERLLELVEPPFLKTVLDHSRGRRAEAAQQIGIHRATLRQKLRKYGLD